MFIVYFTSCAWSSYLNMYAFTIFNSCTMLSLPNKHEELISKTINIYQGKPHKYIIDAWNFFLTITWFLSTRIAPPLIVYSSLTCMKIHVDKIVLVSFCFQECTFHECGLLGIILFSLLPLGWSLNLSFSFTNGVVV